MGVRSHILILVLVVIGLLGTAIVILLPQENPSGYVVADTIRISTAKLDAKLIQEIKNGETTPRVIVLTDDEEQVLNDISRKVDDSSLESRHSFNSFHAFVGEINDPLALAELTKHAKVKKILLDYEMSIVLDSSAPQIQAPLLWNISINGTNLTGNGETICVIDTGMAYTHPAFGSCQPFHYQTTGMIFNISVESAHPYADNADQTWQITRPGFTSIAVHFKAISLEPMPSGADTLDRIYVYDQYDHIIAVYKETQSEIWTPHVAGDTLFIRLVSDSSVTADGFIIDEVLNGTTNLTIDWSSCGSIVGGWDFVNNDADPYDDHGHGTHVAGIIASRNETYKGIAPGAKIAAMKAISSSGSGYASDVMAALEWCNSNADFLNISIISMSLGGTAKYNNYCPDDLLAPLITASYNQNISVFVASGNSGWSDGIANPACIEQAVPVGSVTASDQIIYNRGSLLQLLAPGTDITSAYPAAGWHSLSGTSMATPHAAAAGALLHQYWKKTVSESAAPSQIEKRLVSSGINVQDGSSAYARLDFQNALTPLLNLSEQTDGSSVSFTINADIPLVSTIIEILYPDGTSSNITKSSSTETGLTNLSDGIYTYYVYAWDYGGSFAKSVTRQFQIINEPVELQIISPANGSFMPSPVLLNISILGTSPSSGWAITNKTNFIIDFNSSENSRAGWIKYLALADGEYILTGFAKSSSLSVYQNSSFTIDTTAPRFTSVNYTIEGNHVSFNITIEDQNLNHTLLQTNLSGAWQNTTQNTNAAQNTATTIFNATASGQYGFMAFAVDKAGNWNKTELVAFEVILPAVNNTPVVNNTPPLNNITFPIVNTSLQIISPLNKTTLELGTSTVFQASTSLRGNLSFYWDFGDGTNTSINTNTGTAAKEFLKLGSFITSLNVSNGTSKESTFLVLAINDTIKPAITASYAQEIRSGEALTIDAVITDKAGISGVKLFSEGTAYPGSPGNQSNSSFSWTLTPGNAGTNHFTIEVVDNSLLLENLSYEFTVTSCSDTLQNGDETGTDCGGTCKPCAAADSSASNAEAKEVQKVEEPLPVAAEPLPAALEAPEPAAVNWTDSSAEVRTSRKDTALVSLAVTLIVLLLAYLALSIW
ncbi:S8 family serine peptidase [Candidatus Woesearchaeota archaeon]|nr:S8 family serine peptidase [Candidatus Woesearchaeota archaeon]